MASSAHLTELNHTMSLYCPKRRHQVKEHRATRDSSSLVCSAYRFASIVVIAKSWMASASGPQYSALTGSNVPHRVHDGFRKYIVIACGQQATIVIASYEFWCSGSLLMRNFQGKSFHCYLWKSLLNILVLFLIGLAKNLAGLWETRYFNKIP